ncbi:hypothetical protein AJ80_03094 [Polytolypa hystricis UAMH7299]|uniref:Alpha and gamma adaptin binding protein p34 n=1 Tax=Polytolypa hystricis (strain UAMH7299) TaxID=1447883 RepID=A0A2B7YKS2_POLH7|nr:hypothetical protein AJ80_03094 [Polytolypa hystricis UAMH7299]
MSSSSAPQPQLSQGDNSKSARNISTPRRLLILVPSAHSQYTIPPFLHQLTGAEVTLPPQAAADGDLSEEPTTASFAGYTTHSPLRLRTKYYTADIPVWVDELPLSLPPSSASPSSIHNTSNTTPAEPSRSSSQTTPQPSAPPPPDSSSSTAQISALSHWKTEFLSPEAREVRDVIGAIIICIKRPEGVVASSSVPAGAVVPQNARDHVEQSARALKEFVQAIAEVKGLIEEERGGLGEVPGLVVLVGRNEDKGSGGMKGAGGAVRLDDDDKDFGGLGDGGVGGDDADIEPFSVRWWDEELSQLGIFDFEVVVWDPRKVAEEADGKVERNQFGELEGMPRIREVLQTNEWPQHDSADLGYDDEQEDPISRLLDPDNEETGFDMEANELEREMLGLRLAIERGGDGRGEKSDSDGGDEQEEDDNELRVEQLDGLMLRMQAIRDMGADLPREERKKFAEKAIRDIVKDI